jgi:DNA polymerase-3 subunit delta'
VGFADFHGNKAVVTQLRQMLGRGRLPHSILLSGPEGVGKYRLALMMARAINCAVQPVTDGLPDFCGVCGPCQRIGAAEDLSARVAEAVAARDVMRDVDKRETRILVQTDPDVLVIPPDPPQLLVKVGQVRTVIERSHRHPAERRRVFIFPEARFMKEAANSLLKVLEEPADSTHLFLLAEHPGELLPTMRSRCVNFRLGALEQSEIESLLAIEHPDWPPKQRQLVARLAQGAPERALHFNLEEYQATRADALVLLRTALEANDHTPLFKMTETYRAGAEGQQKMSSLLQASALLLEDVLFVQHGVPEMARNIDIISELERLATMASFTWVEQAAEGLGAVESGMRRNLLRSLSLDAMTARMEGV